jgi:hypothetical protein
LPQTKYETDLKTLAATALQKEEENNQFLASLQHANGVVLDALVHSINARVSKAIDCTECGNCCRTLIVNVTEAELNNLAQHLHITPQAAAEKYIEKSEAGKCYISTMPCHFLEGNKCSIYNQRFTDCREFPHLHKSGFKERLSGTLMHYGSCPIIYNVVEELKRELSHQSSNFSTAKNAS